MTHTISGRSRHASQNARITCMGFFVPSLVKESAYAFAPKILFSREFCRCGIGSPFKTALRILLASHLPLPLDKPHAQVRRLYGPEAHSRTVQHPADTPRPPTHAENIAVLANSPARVTEHGGLLHRRAHNSACHVQRRTKNPSAAPTFTHRPIPAPPGCGHTPAHARRRAAARRALGAP